MHSSFRLFGRQENVSALLQNHGRSQPAFIKNVSVHIDSGPKSKLKKGPLYNLSQTNSPIKKRGQDLTNFVSSLTKTKVYKDKFDGRVLWPLEPPIAAFKTECVSTKILLFKTNVALDVIAL